MVFKEIGQALTNQRAYHPTLEQIKEMIENLSSEDWYALFEWMNAREIAIEDDENDSFDPREEPLKVRYYLMGDRATGFY